MSVDPREAEGEATGGEESAFLPSGFGVLLAQARELGGRREEDGEMIGREEGRRKEEEMEEEEEEE